MDEVYTHIAELVTPKQVLAADLQFNTVCFPKHMHKWKEGKQKENLQSKDLRFLLCLTEIFSSGIWKQ